MEKFLSIIIPYYNRSKIISRLYNQLSSYDLSDVELILIDDGSSDDTFQGLKVFKSYKHAEIKIFTQKNKGPGGARNLGLKNANGKFIWFVDSDDKILIDAYNFLKEKELCDFDFINFNMIRHENKILNLIGLDAGFYKVDENIRLHLLENFGAMYTKIFRKTFLTKINFSYPENCVNEDYYLYFILPFHFENFIKTNIVSYIYHDDTESVTRHKKFNNRLFGRLLSAHNGLVESRKYIISQKEVDIVFKKYEHLFFYSALYIFYSSNINGLSRVYLIKKVLDYEYRNLSKLFSPYSLKKTKFPIEKKTKLLIDLIDLIPFDNKTIRDIYELNNQEWIDNIYYPFK